MNRLFKNWATTIIGLTMCTSAVILYYFNRPMTECAVIFGWGVTFLRSKDSLIGLEK